MDVFGEFLGTALMILLGNGVVAGVVLPKTKSNNSGWIVITLAWGLAVMIAVFVVGTISPAHLNPAVTLAFTLKGDIHWLTACGYISAQIAGAMLGSCCVYIHYKPHYDAEKNSANILATFATSPAIEVKHSNLASEVIGTFVLILSILSFGLYEMVSGLGPLVVALLVVGIGLSLGGTTGYAINPARDFGPRLLHSLLPIKHKGDSAWRYAWIPVIGPLIGSVLAVVVFQQMI